MKRSFHFVYSLLYIIMLDNKSRIYIQTLMCVSNDEMCDEINDDKLID